MKRVFTSTVTVEWHDLMEDPNDLPENPNCNQYCIIRNKITGELGAFWGFSEYDMFQYDPQCRIWSAEEGEGDYYHILWYQSYGQEYKSDDDFDTDFEVVAWSYGPNTSLPGYNPLTKGVWRNGEQTEGQA